MIDIDTWKKAWMLLGARERRNAFVVLGIVVLGALSSSLMVGSVLPFLSVLSEPTRIDTVPALAWAYATFGFESDYVFLVGLGLSALGVIVVTSAIQMMKTWAVARFAMMRVHSISQRLMLAYLRQPYEFFLNRHTGEMSTRILAETQEVVREFYRPAAEAVASACTVAAIVGLMLWLEPVVSLVSFLILGGTYAIIFWLSRSALARLGQTRVDANSSRFRTVNEALTGIKDIKLLGREQAYVSCYRKPSHTMASAMATIQVVALIPKFALEAIAFGGIILLCIVLLDADGLESGAALGEILPILGVFAFAGQRMIPELQKLYRSVAQLQSGGAAVRILYRDLIDCAGDGELPRYIPDGMGLRDLLLLEKVAYQYPSADKLGVREVMLEIRAGEKIGIVGGTGAGKTTLADLVLGLLSPTAGQLVVDGVPVTTANVRAWQQSVGYVPQDIFLTDASVTENISLGVPPGEIDRNRVEEAARIAQLDEFIRTELPDGYDTEIGERGVRLSGGQRQRIGIARALYHDADLIVFDEATSALDNLTERDVMTAIEALPGDKTVLIIAHRLSTVKHCDRIVVMEQGGVVGCDTWAALMDNNPAFQRIAKTHEAV